jgi:hypothetical protein
VTAEAKPHLDKTLQLYAMLYAVAINYAEEAIA